MRLWAKPPERKGFEGSGELMSPALFPFGQESWLVSTEVYRVLLSFKGPGDGLCTVACFFLCPQRK